MTRRSGWSAALALIGAAALAACALLPANDGGRCERLEQLVLDHAEVTSARASSSGYRFSLPAAFLARRPFLEVPASCRVELLLKPTADSEIRSEVWLPQDTWNGKLQGVGNGGFAGSVDRLQLLLSLQKGYAAASTDTGHESSDKDGRWALNHPEKIRDYGWRAIHETAVAAKAVISAYYGKPPARSYFTGGSNGGRAALMEAQRFPEDYDGIVAGCPAYDGTNVLPTWAWIQKSIDDTPGGYLPPQKLPAIAARVLRACDAIDGVADGVLDDPRRCDFKPESMQCTAGDADDCLTTAQVESLRRIYAGPGGALEDSRHRGFEPGGELGDMGGWKDWFTGKKPQTALQYIYAHEFYRYLVYGDADWSLDGFEFARDRAAMRAAIGADLDARNPDLSAFKARGGKLIMFHGWSDGALQPRLAVDYYENVQQRMGAAATDDFMRLYMVPGLQHCAGGPGPNSFGQLPHAGSGDPASDVQAALEAWIEQDRAPQAIVASKHENDWTALLAPEKTPLLRTRPLCPYPQVARWDGTGSTDEAGSFACEAPQAHEPDLSR